MSLDMVVTLSEVADGLEGMQKMMGSIEDYEKLMDRVDDLDSRLQDMDITLGEEEMPDTSDIMAEVDTLVDDEEKAEAVKALPSVPTVVHKTVTATEEEEPERIAEYEYACLLEQRGKKSLFS